MWFYLLFFQYEFQLKRRSTQFHKNGESIIREVVQTRQKIMLMFSTKIFWTLHMGNSLLDLPDEDIWNGMSTIQHPIIWICLLEDVSLLDVLLVEIFLLARIFLIEIICAPSLYKKSVSEQSKLYKCVGVVFLAHLCWSLSLFQPSTCSFPFPFSTPPRLIDSFGTCIKRWECIEYFCSVND